jgi:hypothetical protein
MSLFQKVAIGYRGKPGVFLKKIGESSPASLKSRPEVRAPQI